MKTNRRQFIQATTATVAAAAAAKNSEAADPFAPADPGLTADWFDKGAQHVLPVWAFTRPLKVPPTPMPYATDTWQNLSGGAGHNPSARPYKDAGDSEEIGKVLHGTAVEWNGKMIGGNKKKLADGTWSDVSAWDAMKARVTPDQEGYGITNLGNWGMFAAGGAPVNEAGTNSLVRCYRVEMFEKHAQLRPDAAFPALMYTYSGMLPGPTFRFRHGMPTVVRFVNKLQTEVSIHHHGGHNPTHGDGFPSYYVLQGEARDYLYPNILPLRDAGVGADGKQITEIDFGEGQSTTWYHDHGLDATAFNVSHGLSGFALWFDELELKLIRNGVLPGLRGVSGNEITISDGEFRSWFVEWVVLYALAANGAPAPKLANEWFELAGRVAGMKDVINKVVGNAGVKAAATLVITAPSKDSWKALRDAVDKTLGAGSPSPASAMQFDKAAEDLDPDFQKFYHRRDGNTVPGVGTPYFNPYDIPIALQDRVVDLGTGQIVYDSDGHNGYIGNTQLLNAVAWPMAIVKRRKYRLRVLDGSNARIYRLRFLDSATLGLRANADGDLEPANIPDATLEARSMEFLRIGKDSWLWAMPQKIKSLILNMANRADLVVDFKAWYLAAKNAGRLVPHPKDPSKLVAEYYLVNTMPQFDGRGPKGKLAEDAGDPAVFPLPFELNPGNPVVGEMVRQGVLPGQFIGAAGGGLEELNQPIALMKFIIEDDEGEGEDATIGETTVLRPRHAITDEEVMAVREFVFERGKGAWMINSRFYDPTISNASPVIGIKGQKFRVPDGSKPNVERESLAYAEEWILRNGGGGWWHPIHIHLEGHQLVGYEKDFEADGLVGADGILGAVAQAKMAGLPDWEALVGRFGFDPILQRGTPKADVVKRLRDRLISPNLNGFLASEVAASPQLAILLGRPGSGAALFPLIADRMKAEIAELPAAAAAVFRGLNILRTQWAGELVGNHDTQALGPNTIARIRMRFRTWTGPLVFHCHNVEHEDMRMMVNFEATMSGTSDKLNEHDPNTAPAARSHGQDVTDLLTNPHAVGEMPWEEIEGFPKFRWEEKPIPGTPVDQAGLPLIKPRIPKK